MSELPPPPGPPPSGPPPTGPPPSGPPPSGPPPSGPPPGWEPEPPTPSRGPRPLAVVLGVVGAVLVIGLAILVPVVLSQRDDAESGATSAEPTLDDVEVYEDLPRTHTEEPQDYDQSPPVGGPHHPAWLECGVYEEQVPDENLVHDLEHGTVWITYEPGLDQDSIDTLAAALPDNGILSPYDGLRAPVVVTVWERQLALTGADDPRLELFLDAFGAGETAPEPFASCAGGIMPGATGVNT